MNGKLLRPWVLAALVAVVAGCFEAEPEPGATATGATDDRSAAAAPGDLESELAGWGVHGTLHQDTFRLDSVTRGSPASAAGLLPTDLLVGVNRTAVDVAEDPSSAQNRTLVIARDSLTIELLVGKTAGDPPDPSQRRQCSLLCRRADGRFIDCGCAIVSGVICNGCLSP